MKTINRLILVALLATGLYGLAGERQATFRTLVGNKTEIAVTADDTFATVRNKIRESGLLGEGNANRRFIIIQRGSIYPVTKDSFDAWREECEEDFTYVVFFEAAHHHPQQENPQEHYQGQGEESDQA